MKRYHRALLGLSLALGASACSDDPVGPGDNGPDFGLSAPVALPVLGHGPITDRYTAELWVRDGTAYTSSWGTLRGNPGNTVYVWDVRNDRPQLADSLLVPGSVTTTGDVQVSDDGKLLAVATEPEGSLVLYDLADPRRPRLLTRYITDNTRPGVHTAEIARVNGRLYGFLSIDPRGGRRARLVVVDLSDPSNPREVFTQEMGQPFIHDVFVRDGYLFTALWDEGLAIWDIGARGGSPAAPVRVSTIATAGGNVHNAWWYHDASGARRYLFVGEEQSGFGQNSAGDIHVVDVSDVANPREVAFFHVPDATVNGALRTYGTHNFSVDEKNGVLYAAFYNGGVRALDVRGDLGACAAAAKDALGRCDLGKMQREVGRALSDSGAYIWGVFHTGDVVYASDMNGGLWKLGTGPLLGALRR